jgi:hypothetical protein
MNVRRIGDVLEEPFETMLTGGHPNSLGRTIEVVDTVLANPERFTELFNCYGSRDEVVRLRVSNALKRVEAERHDLLVPVIDRLIDEIGNLDQASAQWTLADLFARLRHDMTSTQFDAALSILKRNLSQHKDWIVLNRTIDTLSSWAKQDSALSKWLCPHLERLSEDPRKSVAKRATKALEKLDIP